MGRSAFIVSSALHAGLLALLCGVAFRENAGPGPADGGPLWSASAEAAGELVVADSSEPGSDAGPGEQLPAFQPANPLAIPDIRVIAAPAFAPLTTNVSIGAAIAPSIAALPSFAQDGAPTPAGSGKGVTRRAAAKGGGSPNRGESGGGPAYTPARYVHCPPPAFPPEARKARVSGVVLLLVQIDERGRPIRIALRRTSGHAVLDTAAQRAVRLWRFEPARRDGKPVDARLEVPVRFALS